MSIVEKAAARLRSAEQRGPAHVQPRPDAREYAGEDAPNGAQRPESLHLERTTLPTETVHIEEQALQRAGLTPPKSTAPLLAREYQRIKRPVLASLETAVGHNRVMVTSAMAGEGKTFTATNLALSLARERDHSVLLVDGDVIKPTLTRALDLRDRSGLMDILRNTVKTPEETIVATDVPGFSVLPAGQRCDQMSELLSSRRMGWLADRLAAEPNRIVIFDSPPLLATAESQALALNMGQVLMVVKAGRTERRAIDAALSLIAAPSIAISLILNQSRRAHGDSYAGYYGMYYDGGEN